MSNAKRLESERLILREFKVEDAEDVYNNWTSDSQSCKYLSWNVHRSIDETRSIIKEWINEYENGSYNWIVELKENSELIGNICIVKSIDKYGLAEIGYCYGSKYWGKGYATEALRTVLEYLLKECDFYMIEAKHISGNPASGRVMEKAGMHKDGVLRERRINKFTGQRNDLIVYSMKSDEL